MNENKQAAEVYQSFFSIAGQLRKLAQQSAEHLGLTVSQLIILGHVLSHPSQTQKDVTEQLRLAKSRVSIHIDVLVQQGLVKREVSEQDRRETKLTITEAGERLYRLYKEEAHSYKALETALQSFSQEEIDNLLRMHKQLLSRM